jgi:hypothetical protein
MHRRSRRFGVRPGCSRPGRIFLDAEGPDRGEISFDAAAGHLVTIRKAIPGRLAVLSEGRRAGQFHVCGSCGAGFTERQSKHKTPLNSDCLGTLARVSLGHEFVTDVVRVEFHQQATVEDVGGDLTGLGLGVATALLDGMAEIVGVPSVDLNVTIGQSASARFPVIVLYDAVPGGAGLVAHIENKDVFRRSLEAAYRRVEGGCECGEDTSCYGCLRSYRNQYAHTQLRRGPVKRYLRDMLRLLEASG